MKLKYLNLHIIFFIYATALFGQEAPESVKDIDGNVYHIMKSGSYLWMTENLKVTHYSNGDDIPNVVDSAKWTKLKTGAYCNFNNDTAKGNTGGRLYNWYAVNNSRNICPSDWAVPSPEMMSSLPEIPSKEAPVQIELREPNGLFASINGRYNYTFWSSLETDISNASTWAIKEEICNTCMFQYNYRKMGSNNKKSGLPVRCFKNYEKNRTIIDKVTGTKYAVDVKQFYITATDSTGKQLWRTDPWKDNKIEQVTADRGIKGEHPIIEFFYFVENVENRNKKEIFIIYKTEPYKLDGFIDRETGKFELHFK